MKSMISGKAARAARESAKISQSEAAQAVGINRVYYSLFESGRYLLDDDEQQRLLEFFDSRSVEIRVGDAEPTPAGNRRASRPADAEVSGSYDARLSKAVSALGSVRETVEGVEHGLRSKRTATDRTTRRSHIADAVSQTLCSARLMKCVRNAAQTSPRTSRESRSSGPLPRS